MSAVTTRQLAERISVLMTERMHVKGQDLEEKLARAGRRLPRREHKAALALAEAAHQAQNPKLLLQIDEESVAANYDICVKYLSALNRGHRLRGMLLGISTSILFSLLAVVAVLIAVLMWRGFL
ncbi:hypothetical protein EOK75_19945 (plasmid) [Pseudorhodobacter turbinis]|uniref:Uncharacterized protein n=1 Tax=Pseudorhodobacter turbinis TaxID=2500533 RepID=A0A4P8EM71_9RHOB|nr:hypothetical protein [Pseudorhodobacter turbinis]QCO57925.1 hypothetical protein EOK75_19945 [Pseudorhodobacter turbinis]